MSFANPDYTGQINHIDDNKMNTHISNLYVGTQRQNISDRKRNGHDVGNIAAMVILDKKENKVLLFCSAKVFLTYAGHPQKNRGIKKVLSKKWFKNNYEVVFYEKISSKKILESVTTIGDECSRGGRILPPSGAHCRSLSELLAKTGLKI